MLTKPIISIEDLLKVSLKNVSKLGISKHKLINPVKQEKVKHLGYLKERKITKELSH